MSRLESVQALYRDYLEKAEELEKNRKPGQGLFGVGAKPADDPCHERFIRELYELLSTSDEAESGGLRETLAYIYHAPLEHKEPASIYWTLIAAHGATLKRIPSLTASDAGALAETYAATYRRWNRLPVQDKVIDALKAQRG